MAKAARNVRSRSKFAGDPLTPLDAQEFLDFFGRGETSVNFDKEFTKTGAPKSLTEFAPSFTARQVEKPIFDPSTTQLDVDNPLQKPVQIGTQTVTESKGDIGRRTGNRRGNRRDNPLWKQAYDAALIQFNKQADVRKADEAKRKQQREGRKEREDRAIAEGGATTGGAGTTLITGAQGFLGGQGGAGSLLR